MKLAPKTVGKWKVTALFRSKKSYGWTLDVGERQMNFSRERERAREKKKGLKLETLLREGWLACTLSVYSAIIAFCVFLLDDDNSEGKLQHHSQRNTNVTLFNFPHFSVLLILREVNAVFISTDKYLLYALQHFQT